MNVLSFSCIVPCEIIFQFICSYLILKIHFYKLQYFSLFLNLGIFIIILIIDLVNILSRNPFDGVIYCFYLINLVSYSIEYSLGKKIFLYGFLSVYSLMIIKGFISLILTLLFSLITFLVNKDIFSKIGFFFTVAKCVWLIIAKIFTMFFMELFIWLLMDRFAPNYYPIVQIFNEFVFFIFDVIDNSNDKKFRKWEMYFRIFLYLILIIGVLIHNEIVVINICNLGSDTKYFLDLELQKEELFTKTDNPDIIKRYETLMEMDSKDDNCVENEEEKYLSEDK